MSTSSEYFGVASTAFALGAILLVLLMFSVLAHAQAEDPREADCQVKEDNTYVEDIMDADCEPSEQDGMITSIVGMDMPQYSLESQALGPGEETAVQVTIWHDNPNMDYNCQIRSANGETQHSWTEFEEVRRQAHANSPTTLSQSIRAPQENVTSPQEFPVTVEVFCYGPASNEPYPGGLMGSNLWIAQAYFEEELSYTYPDTGAESEDDVGVVFVVALGLLGLGGIGGAGVWVMTRRDIGSGDEKSPGTGATDSQSTAERSGDTADRSQGAARSAGSLTGTGQLSDAAASLSLSDRRIPDAIPGGPDIAVQYAALTDEQPIGTGGNADVSQASLPTDDGVVTLAIKRPRMPDRGTISIEELERLLGEAETWDRLDDHDYIVDVVDYGSEPIPWIAMEYMDGGHLGARAGELSVQQALWTAIAITQAVRHAHRRGVAHLDLKPQNVLFRSVEEKWDVPKVADWGLSKHLLDQSQSVEGLSPQYAAPEQFSDEYGPADDITDVYQLGAVFYELFTGQPPFEGKPAKAMHKVLHEQPTPPSEITDVPHELDEILLTALAKEKDDRYESVLLLRNDLQDLYERT